jgi:hypothetical protein
MSKEAMTRALELAQEGVEIHSPNSPEYKVCAALIEALAKQEHAGEPVAWRYDQAKYRFNDLRGRQWAFNVFSQARPYIDEMVQNVTPLYTTPQPKQKHRGEPVAWRVSYPNEPELGFWFAEGIGGEGCLNEPLYTAPQPKADKHTDDLCQVLIQKTHIQERQIAELQAQLLAQSKQSVSVEQRSDSEHVGEPVAWMRKDGQRVTTASDRHNYPDYETRYSIPLYTTPQPAPQRPKAVFPTMLRKMWSGGEVQAWLDENVNKEKNT